MSKQLDKGLAEAQRHLRTGEVSYGFPGEFINGNYVAAGWASTPVTGERAEVTVCFHQRLNDGGRYLNNIGMTASQARAMAQLLLHSADIADSLKAHAATAWNGAPVGEVLQ